LAFSWIVGMKKQMRSTLGKTGKISPSNLEI
jgi:hypothetical protein